MLDFDFDDRTCIRHQAIFTGENNAEFKMRIGFEIADLWGGDFLEHGCPFGLGSHITTSNMRERLRNEAVEMLVLIAKRGSKHNPNVVRVIEDDLVGTIGICMDGATMFRYEYDGMHFDSEDEAKSAMLIATRWINEWHNKQRAIVLAAKSIRHAIQDKYKVEMSCM